MTILAFSGTRKGMTAAQRRTLRARFMAPPVPDRPRVERFHHGKRIGADEDFHDIAMSARIPVETWPGHIPELRAPCLGAEIEHEPMDCIARNHAFVDRCQGLVLAPSGHKEARQSGTWATARYAREQGKPVYVVWPDGRLEKWTGQDGK